MKWRSVESKIFRLLAFFKKFIRIYKKLKGTTTIKKNIYIYKISKEDVRIREIYFSERKFLVFIKVNCTKIGNLEKLKNLCLEEQNEK